MSTLVLSGKLNIQYNESKVFHEQLYDRIEALETGGNVFITFHKPLKSQYQHLMYYKQ